MKSVKNVHKHVNSMDIKHCDNANSDFSVLCNQQQFQGQSTETVMNSEKGYIDIVISNTTVKALVDTGAAVSCIDQRTYQSLGLATLALSTPDQILSHAGGGALHTLGYLQVPFTLGGSSFTNKCYVVEALSFTVILGRDFLRSCQADISFKNNALTAFSNTNSVQNINIVSNIKHHFGSTTSDITIPPKCEQIISIRTKGTSSTTFLAEPVQWLMTKHYLAGAKCVVNVIGKSTVFRLCNPTHLPIVLTKGTRVALLTPITSDSIVTSLQSQTITGVDTQQSKPSELNQEHIDTAKALGIDVTKSSLTQDQQLQLLEFIGKHRTAFAKDSTELVGTDLYHHTIHTGSAVPVRSAPYKASPRLADIIEHQVDTMLNSNIVEPSTSEWASPVVLVKKKNGDYWFAVDYRKLNKVTENLMSVIPRFSEVVDAISEAKPKLFSVLDLASGFWQIPLDPVTKHKIAFVTRSGVYSI